VVWRPEENSAWKGDTKRQPFKFARARGRFIMSSPDLDRKREMNRARNEAFLTFNLGL
jgi:hypothetical protein